MKKHWKLLLFVVLPCTAVITILIVWLCVVLMHHRDPFFVEVGIGFIVVMAALLVAFFLLLKKAFGNGE